ncbi:MAG: hypothetical protein ACI9J2_001955 [Saprospiraceae bacterium]|jgi:hypothetical protein
MTVFNMKGFKIGKANLFVIAVSGLLAAFNVSALAQDSGEPSQSVARVWNEALLEGIRLDTARPTVHARNLYHLSATMWDAWAAYHPEAKQLFHQERREFNNLNKEQTATISYAAYTLLHWRFKHSDNYQKIKIHLEQALTGASDAYGFVVNNQSDAITLGHRVAKTMIAYGLGDGANEQNDYQSKAYQPVNERLNPHLTGNSALSNPDRWQGLDLPGFVGQSGIRSEGYPPFVGPEWGSVDTFSLIHSDRVLRQRNGVSYSVYLDKGAPPSLLADKVQRQAYINGFKQVLAYSQQLDANSEKVLDISPGVRGNAKLGSLDGAGRALNPFTLLPYKSALAKAADYHRVLAEYWADGPDSETPPGHWFVMFNLVSDQPSIVANLGKQNKAKNRLQWDLQGYLALGGAMHDAAVAAWSHKGWYDYIRPISAIRALCDNGQSSAPSLPRYSKLGMALKAGLIELVTAQSAALGERHYHLIGENGEGIGQIAVNTWRGPQYVENRRQNVAGVGWINCGDWWPYQRPNFVTPPFAGYVSGHSTFSRAAAEVITLLTGSEFFPGGIGIFSIKQNHFLVFERGPSQDIKLQWATYQDAADDSAISRIYGGIHPPQDDMRGRLLGYEVGHRAYEKALSYFPN